MHGCEVLVDTSSQTSGTLKTDIRLKSYGRLKFTGYRIILMFLGREQWNATCQLLSGPRGMNSVKQGFNFEKLSGKREKEREERERERGERKRERERATAGHRILPLFRPSYCTRAGQKACPPHFRQNLQISRRTAAGRARIGRPKFGGDFSPSTAGHRESALFRPINSTRAIHPASSPQVRPTHQKSRPSDHRRAGIGAFSGEGSKIFKRWFLRRPTSVLLTVGPVGLLSSRSTNLQNFTANGHRRKLLFRRRLPMTWRPAGNYCSGEYPKIPASSSPQCSTSWTQIRLPFPPIRDGLGELRSRNSKSFPARFRPRRVRSSEIKTGSVISITRASIRYITRKF